MKSGLILALDDCPLTSISGPLEIFELANSLVEPVNRMNVGVVSGADTEIAGMGGLCLTTHGTLEQHSTPVDLIVIGAIGPPKQRKAPVSSKVINWLKFQYAEGAVLASICTGAFVLAETGLLSGVKATTHWANETLFKQRYPDVDLHCEEMITEHGSLLCSGGASAFQDMSLHLVSQFFGHKVALRCARALLIDLDRHSQLRYKSFVPQRQHSDDLIHGIQDYMDAQIERDTPVSELAKQANLSDRQFIRRFKQATEHAPLTYIQLLRIEKAKRMLCSSRMSVEKICFESGYQDVRFFRRLFKRHTGLAPTEFRDKFSLRLNY